MSEVIKEYYEKMNVPAPVIEGKLELFARNPDISAAFEKWIEDKEFDDSIEVEGYTVSRVAALSPYLNGEGAFSLMVELRENPEKAHKRIRNGFKIK